jgi:hypothetical protein
MKKKISNIDILRSDRATPPFENRLKLPPLGGLRISLPPSAGGGGGF